jgi:hypothetical protein
MPRLASPKRVKIPPLPARQLTRASGLRSVGLARDRLSREGRGLKQGQKSCHDGMARGGIGTAQLGEAALKPVLSSSPGSSGDFALGQSSRVKGQEPVKGQGWSCVPPCQNVGLAKRRSASQPVMAGGLVALWRQTEAP